MSRWLERALARKAHEAPVPIAPLAPEGPDHRSSGTNGANGTRLHPSSPALDREDWQAHFDERAGIREFDGGFPRAEAERLAREDTIAVLGPEPAQ